MKKFENPLRFDKVVVVSTWLTFLAHPVGLSCPPQHSDTTVKTVDLYTPLRTRMSQYAAALCIQQAPEARIHQMHGFIAGHRQQRMIQTLTTPKHIRNRLPSVNWPGSIISFIVLFTNLVL